MTEKAPPDPQLAMAIARFDRAVEGLEEALDSTRVSGNLRASHGAAAASARAAANECRSLVSRLEKTIATLLTGMGKPPA